MAKSMGSGLAIGVAAATALAALVVLYLVTIDRTLSGDEIATAPDAQTDVNTQTANSQTEVSEPEVKVEETQPKTALIEPQAEIEETVPDVTPEETQVEITSEDDPVDDSETPVAKQPETVQSEETEAEPEIEVETVELIPSPSFDLVRVDKTGSTVVAGKAIANSSVDITLNGAVVGTVEVNGKGAFVALLDIVPSDEPRELGLVQKRSGEVDIASVDKVLVMPFTQQATEAPKLVIAKPGSVDVVTETKVVEAEPDQTDTETTTQVVEVEPLSLDTIVYDDLGDVVISGQGRSDDFVRIYLDNKPADVQKITDNGQWKITLSDVPEGIYDLRVDSVDSAGSVTERVQSPFKRESTKAIVASTSEQAQSSVTIQPGFTLWAVAKKRYGDGVRYVQIFEANRKRIKDPDLIYPGQVFDLPN